MIEREDQPESTNSGIWELELLDFSLRSTSPQLEHICNLAEWNAELMGREKLHDPLLLLLKKFFTGDWRKKIGDQDEATELVTGMETALEKVPLQDVLSIIKEIGQERADLEEKILALKDEIDRLTTAEQSPGDLKKSSSVNQLVAELQESVKKIETSTQKAELTAEDKIDIAQELADFVYMLAKLKNAKQDRFPAQQQIDELLDACGGFSFAETLKFCYYKYGSRLARDRVEFGTGKDKKREQTIFTELIRRMEKTGKKLDLSKIDIQAVQRKMREILFQIIGVPERMVVTCDLIVHGKYHGKEVRLLIPRKQDFIYEDSTAGQAIAYSNFMTTGAVGNHAALEEILTKLPTGTIQADQKNEVINGYKIEKGGKVVRIQGIPTIDQPTAIDILTTLELGIQEKGIISFSTDVIREAFIGLPEDELAVTKKLQDASFASQSWLGYAELVNKLIIDGDSPRLVQTVPAINTFKSGRTGINTHALLFRGELKVSEETIEQLIATGKAQYLDTETEIITAPILVIEAEKKSGLLFQLSTRVDNSEKSTLDHSVVIGKPTFGKSGPKIAISTNSLL